MCGGGGVCGGVGVCVCVWGGGGGGVRWSINEEGEAVKTPVLRLGVFSPVRADLMRQFRSAGNRDKREGHSIYIC